MLEFGSFVQDARAPVASPVPPSVTLAAPLKVQLAVALLFQRQSWLLMLPQYGTAPPGFSTACSIGFRLPDGTAEVSAGNAPRRRASRNGSSRRAVFASARVARDSDVRWPREAGPAPGDPA